MVSVAAFRTCAGSIEGSPKKSQIDENMLKSPVEEAIAWIFGQTK